MKKTLSEAFELNEKTVSFKEMQADDYEIFEDKILLDTLRNKVIQNIIDNDVPDNEFLTEYINN